ncbi:metallophosphoesterase family protein [Paenibacillus mendelii]|uniref:Metallophosphoesterase n=1 Tax=Paenibacillus mendelii TaxID=206163 RepID=A0ABV6JET4_9BACL|nr:metallophosphoesterase [Paenibacillus mendelii]MCQ6557284.1 metallophosphoesterase [Paenibacillus mendelii]
MKILVVSDEESKFIWDHFDPEKFKDVRLIISCGDLKAAYLSFLVSMIHAPLLYVHGNHDTDYKVNPPEGCDSIEDRIVTFKGVRILGLGGSFRYSPGDYQYTERQMRWRITKLKPKLLLSKGVDILVTHAPVYKLGDGEDLCHRGFECFSTFMNQYNPKYLLHGHQHLNYGRNQRIHRYKNTEIVNAFGYYFIEV